MESADSLSEKSAEWLRNYKAPDGKKDCASVMTLVDWNSVRNHTAFRAERNLGHIKWGWGEVDVYIMRDCCQLQPDTKTKPKLNPGSSVQGCGWAGCDAYIMTEVFAVRHLLVHHLEWPHDCGHCRKPMAASISSHVCLLPCPLCPQENRTILSLKQTLSEHMYSEHGVFYCQLCEQTFPSLSEMKEHVLLENSVLTATCILCKKILSGDRDGRAMKNHIIKDHLGPQINKLKNILSAVGGEPVTKSLELVDSSRGSEPQLVTKISMRYKPMKTETYEFDNFKCPHCSRLFSARAGLKIHVGIAHRGGSITFCPRCPSTFQDVGACKRHLKLSHSKSGRTKRDKSDQAQAVDSPEKVSTSAVPTNVPMSGEQQSSVMEDPSYPVMDIESDQPNPGLSIKAEQMDVDSARFIAEPGEITPLRTKKPLPALLKISDSSQPSPVVARTSDVMLKRRSPSLELQSRTGRPVEQYALEADKKNTCSPVSKTKKNTRLSDKLFALKKKISTEASSSKFVPILPKPSVQASWPVNLSDLSPVKHKKNVVDTEEQGGSERPKIMIPVVGQDGVTILVDLTKAQGDLSSGNIQFITAETQPTNSQSNLTYNPAKPRDPASESPDLVVLDPEEEGVDPLADSDLTEEESAKDPLESNTSFNKGSLPQILSVEGAVPSSCIMRDKVALNLPVVLTKRTNKKLAQDNPFCSVSMVSDDVVGSCRLCTDFTFTTSFNNKMEMMAHFRNVHRQEIEIKRFSLYYEISCRQSTRAKKKYFLCYLCGKEFTTKFNVRRHQMLYCPRKLEIDPRLLGLGPRVDEDEADLSYGQEFSSKEQEAFSREQEASFSKEPARKKLSSKKISRSEREEFVIAKRQRSVSSITEQRSVASITEQRSVASITEQRSVAIIPEQRSVSSITEQRSVSSIPDFDLAMEEDDPLA